MSMGKGREGDAQTHYVHGPSSLLEYCNSLVTTIKGHAITVLGQALARVIVKLGGLLIERGCSVTIRWTPAHKGVEENEAAGFYAKLAAETHYDLVGRAYLQEASLAHLARKTTESGPRQEQPGVPPSALRGVEESTRAYERRGKRHSQQVFPAPP